MNLVEARDWVEEAISPLEFAGQEINRRLNLENDHISRELRVPTRLVRNIDATQPFGLPVGARPGSVVRVWHDERGYRVPVLSVEEAHRKYPRWLDSNYAFAKFVVFEPYNLTAPLNPRGFFSDDRLRIMVVVKPADLVEDGDVIFQGELPEFHELVPKKVASDILIGHSDGVTNEAMLTSLIRRGGLLRDEVQESMKAAFARAWYMQGMA